MAKEEVGQMGHLVYPLVFWGGLIVGFLLHHFLAPRHYSGTMLVSKEDLTEKTVYTLVLDDYPEVLQFKKSVVFKVEAADESL